MVLCEMRALLALLLSMGSACTLATSTTTGSSGGAEPALRSGSEARVIRGTVRNEHGFELGGLLVLAVAEEQPSRTGYTDAQGNYSIEALTPGAYVLRVWRGPEVVAERCVEVGELPVRDTHFIVPERFGDRPEHRRRAIVDRALVSSSPRR